MLYDINLDVSFYASVNPNTPDHDRLMAKLIELAEGRSSQRAWVAIHPSLPTQILSRLAADIDSDVRLNVAINPHTPVDILVKLADDKNSKVRFHTAINPNTPSSLSQQLLSNLANDKDSMIRLHVAKFLETPVDVLVQLAQDEHSEVRRAANNNPNR
ncbi:HEAT repeat domain-containing protein [Nostoc sp. CENA543]|uniref:HEAT repeat domain-containing protein n=1 Tax=Nostoc sp. CENA543 TaxID=1869241 RepID=UPI001CEF9013|nr:HEAT repeat domain-containing protein [Nostoc sp. CENA543]